jgi:hypothetical protein
MPLPAALALGGSLLSGFLGGRSKKKAAEAEREEAQRVEDLQRAQFEAGQGRRGDRLSAIQGLLQRVGGSLPEGAPDYAFDPAILQAMQRALPFAPGGALPTGETGESQLGGLIGGIGDAAGTAILADRPELQIGAPPVEQAPVEPNPFAVDLSFLDEAKAKLGRF